MRSIRELLTTEEKVWVYIGNEELWADFLRSAEGFTFGELPRDKWKFGHVRSSQRRDYGTRFIVPVELFVFGKC